jgi:membrane associated rhomboid family serine protease
MSPDAPPSPDDSEAPLEITADMLAAPEAVDTRVDFERGMSVWPALSIALIAANAAVFAWEVARGALASTAAITAAGALDRERVLHGEIYRIPWSAFLHGSFAHLAGNCVILYIVGMGLEHAVGRLATAAVYAAAALAGAGLSLFANPGPSVGASGAIFGVAAALVVFLFRFRRLYFVRDKQIGYVLLAWAAWTLISGFLDPQVDNFCHLGGAAAGAALALLLKPRIPPPTPGFVMQVRR